MSTSITITPFLRWALLADALASGATGLLLLVLGSQLQALLGLPGLLLFGAGLFLLPYAAVIAWMGQRRSVPRWALTAVIVGNALWALDCLLLAVTGLLSPTALGVMFLLAQAVVVGVFAELQYVGMRRVARAVPQARMSAAG